jgi:hypothetical protein
MAKPHHNNRREQPQQPQGQGTARQHPPNGQSTWTSPDWKTIVSFASALIALLALVFTIYQAYLQRQFQKASVRPRMTISFFYDNDGAGFMFGGTGIGYSTMKTFEVLVDGKPQPDWTEMCRALGFASKPTFEFTVPRRETIFKPDSYNKVFWIPSGPQAEELKLKSGRIQIRTCYCSVFDECWQVDTHDEVPEAVDSCSKPEMNFTAPPRLVHLP